MSNFRHNVESIWGPVDFFWGKYKALNNVGVPSDDVIKNFQLQKIEQFQNLALKKDKKTLTLINDLFKNGDVNALNSENQRQQEEVLSTVITNIANKFQSLRDLNKKDYKIQHAETVYQDAKYKMEELRSILIKLKDTLSISSKVYEKDLEILSNAIENNNLKSFNQASVKAWMGQLNQKQGELIEEIGTAWLNKRIPLNLEIQAYNTGKLYNTKEKSQLIQDIIIIDSKKVNLLQTPIKYTIDGKSYDSTLEKLLNLLPEYNGNKLITIDDNVQSLLNQLSVLNIQSKSGIHQLPFNQNLKTQVSISEFGNVSYGIPIIRTFSLLNSLDNEYPKHAWVHNTSQDYDSLANYGLSTMIPKILSLSKDKNQYLLTSSGFITYGERIKQLFEERQGIMKFSQSIVIENTVLSKMRTVTIKQ